MMGFSSKKLAVKKNSAALKLEEEIAGLKSQNKSLLEELRRQNEYDISQGRAPGKFREHFTLSCIEANKKSIEQLEESLSQIGGPTTRAPNVKEQPQLSAEDGTDRRRSRIYQTLISPFVSLFGSLKKDNKNRPRARTLPPRYFERQDDNNNISKKSTVEEEDSPISTPKSVVKKVLAEVKPVAKYNKSTQEKVDRLEGEIAELLKQNSKLVSELKTYEEYDRSQGRTPGKFREHMTLSLVESNKKSIEQLEEVLASLKRGSKSKGVLGKIMRIGRSHSQDFQPE